MDQSTHRIRKTASTGSSVESADALLDTFFAQAAEVEPESLPTVGQLRWRAEIIARLETEERLAARATGPVLIGSVVSALLAMTGLVLFVAGFDLRAIAQVGSRLAAAPWVLPVLAGCMLSSVVLAARFGTSRMLR